MKLKDRLSLYSLLIFSIIILMVSSVIYFSFYSKMEMKELKSLESKSLLAAIYYLEQDELPSREHDDIKNQLLKTISPKNIAIYSVKDQKVNGEMQQDTSISDRFLEQVKQNKQASFNTSSFFYNGIFYQDNQGNFVVIVRESKADFNDQMNSLLQILVIVSALGLGIIYLFSQYLGYIAFQPINHFIAQIKSRNGINFNKPITIYHSYSELKELTETYNVFIAQITQTFEVQKKFIDYVSHELRTPLTALMGTLEVTNQKDRSVSEHQQVITQLKQYTNDLQEAIDQMMLLSGAKTNVEFQLLRIDEIIWEIMENQLIYQQVNIKVDLQVSNEQVLSVKGDAKLLNLAISNLISNAIKYSNNQQVNIEFSSNQDQLILKIFDQGIGIDVDELMNVRQRFYRGKNTANFQGRGIGLSLADVIFKLHKIVLEIEPNQPKGTIMILKFNS